MTKIKQIWLTMRQDPVLSVIGLVATALSIFLIMIVIVTSRVKVADIYPETNRSRSLYYSAMILTDSVKKFTYISQMSELAANEIFRPLKSADAVTVFERWSDDVSVSAPGVKSQMYTVKKVDDSFWKVFDFKFTQGGPFDEAQFHSRDRVAVIDADVANKFFGSKNAVGGEIEINSVQYKVVGVVHPCSSLASDAYANIWTIYQQSQEDDMSPYLGNLSVVVTAPSSKDLDGLRSEMLSGIDKTNKLLESSSALQIAPFGRPYRINEHAIETNSNSYNDPKDTDRRNLLILAVLVLVPAINLSAMTQSRLKRRNDEIAIRRAFGSTRSSVVLSIIWENLIITVVAGAIGWLLSVIFVYYGAGIVFGGSDGFSGTLHFGDLINVGTFLAAVGFCFLLNLISSIVPAINASRRNIAEVLGGNNR